ncbi:helix-turn-helix transcriptional regulator [Streptomyces sp. NBC_01443]|uniref:helix-turn-helix domain-containing protein n=1 Tax=Streptomyces sp. NBC_01443 TaxID=2903868 RepID=UPI0022577478|nr:helix-turn-helix transcriptional regulator [Streptomyces sp. NBC_01443]MCX4632826.1 helix-turn-helix domain-containing protein [Streptomyces sp. NBC_01443]
MPNQRAKPTLRRRRLGGLLADCRDRAGLSSEEAATRMGWHHTKLSKVENARAGVTPKDINLLMSTYGVTDVDLISALQGLARDAAKQGWWATYGDVVANPYKDYLYLESDAVGIRFYGGHLVPGLLQRPEYAKAIITGTAMPPKTSQEVQALVDVRMARQAVLSRADRSPLKLRAVIHQSVLRQEFRGEPSIMLDQLEHLLYMSDRTNITIQVMPMSASAHPGLLGLFSVVDFEKPWPTVVQLENILGGTFVEGTEDVQQFDDAFEGIVAEALPVDASREAIKNRIKEIRP